MRDKAYSTATLYGCVGKRASGMETTKFVAEDGFGGRFLGRCIPVLEIPYDFAWLGKVGGLGLVTRKSLHVGWWEESRRYSGHLY
jgi:hypothetical protein